MEAIHTAGTTLLAILTTVSICSGQPVITNQPAPQAAAPGASVTFRVGARSVEPLTYQWQRDPGNGFSDLADRTNAALVLANVQSWDASDYRAVVTDLTGARTSAVARLYVLRRAPVTTKVVIDNFDDNRPTGWISDGHKGQATFTETHHQFHLHGNWPGVHTVDFGDTTALAILARNWSVTNGQTVELRVDLVGMNEHASAGGVDFWNGSSGAGYALYKGHDFVHLCKPSLSVPGIHGLFFHERILIKNTNVVLALAVTRIHPNVILTARVLDKEREDAVLYERSIVDTPGVDRTLTQAEMEAASGMHMDAGTDVGAPLTSGSHVFLGLFQYTDGTRPAAEVTFDNLERWTSVLPVWRPELAIRLLSAIPPRVDLTLSAPPNSSWAIERALELTGAWTNLSVLLIGTNCSAQFQETKSPNSSVFYRARQR